MSFDVKPNIRYLPARWEVVDAYSDRHKARHVFGHDATIPLEQGVARMAQWARSVGPRQSTTFDQVEVLRNMPPSWKAVLKDVA